MDEFLSHLFTTLGYSAEKQEYIRASLKELIMANVTADFVGALSEPEAKEFSAFLMEADQSEEKITQWMQKNMTKPREDLVKVIADSVQKTYKDLFVALMADLTPEQKEAVRKLTEVYLK